MKKLRKGVGARARDFLRDWSIPRQLAGQNVMSDAAKSHASETLRPRLEEADRVGTSVCPYCAVGCAQLIYSKNGKPIHIEGDPRSPVNGGTLCPKGAGTLGMLLSPERVSNVLYRAPNSDKWETRPLDWAMERIAQLTKQTRDETFADTLPDGRVINQTLGIGSLGGATMDNEENYLIKKLFTGGLGVVNVENQARI
jgi:formate dehydrogenase major subunit